MEIKKKNFKAIIYGLVALAPVFFLWASQNVAGMDVFNKIILFQLALSILFVFLLFRPFSFLKEKISFSFLDFSLVLWLMFNLLSAIIGNDFYVSFWGVYGSLNTPVILLFCLVFWYFLLKWGRVSIKNILKVFIFAFSLALPLLASLFALVSFGAIKPSSYLFDIARLALGTTEQLSMYLPALLILSLGMIIGKKIYLEKTYELVSALAVLTASIGFLIAFNFLPSWLSLSVGLLMLLLIYLFNEIRQKTFSVKKPFILLLALFVLSSLFIVFHFLNGEYYSNKQRLAPRLQLDWQDTKDLAFASVKKEPLFGYGAEMFAPVYSANREVVQNNEPYWYVRFNQGSSFFFEQLVSIGFFGVLTFIAFLLALIYIVIRLAFFEKNNDTTKTKELYPLLSSVIALIVALFFYSANFLVLFLFFTILAFISKKYHRYYSAKFTITNNVDSKNRGLTFVLLLVTIFCITSTLFNVKHLMAVSFYETGKKAGDKTEGKQLEALETAVNLNPHIYQYHLSLSDYYHKHALKALKQTDNIDNDFVQDYINKAIEQAQTAIDNTPYAVAPYENLAKIYRDLGENSAETFLLAIDYFEKAIAREPSNPVLQVEKGMAHLKLGNVDEAIKALSQARDLKSDYYLAEYNLAKAYIGANQNEEALVLLNKLSEERVNIDILYEQGRAYFNLKKYDEAIRKFSQVISIEPQHANSLYSLGLSYSALDEVDEAMYYLKKVADLNPENLKLIEQISGLENIQ